MQINSGLVWNPATQKLSGMVTCLPDGPGIGTVDFSILLPGLKPASIYSGSDKFVASNQNGPIWLHPGGPEDAPGGAWTTAIVVPLAEDLTGDGTVDAQDSGQVLSEWGEGSAELLGKVMAAWGAKEQLVASKLSQITEGSSMVHVGGAPALNSVHPLVAPALGKFRLRFSASAGTKVVFTVNASFLG